MQRRLVTYKILWYNGGMKNRGYFDQDDWTDEIGFGEFFSKPQIVAFLVTFFIVLSIGVPILFIVNSIKNPARSAVQNNFANKWEIIPEATVAENAAVSIEEDDVAMVELPVEDEYTHIITTADPEMVTMGFTGDILFDTGYAAGDSFRRAGNTAEGVVGQSLLEKMRGVDIMMVNNEFAYSNGGAPTEGKTYTFRANPSTASILNTMGVDIAGIANNHAYDYGPQAFLDTIAALDAVGVEHSGGGVNIEEASHPVYYVTQNGMKIAYISATQIERQSNPDTKGATADSPGVFRCLDDALLLEKVREARAQNAFVVVFIHWGTESTTDIHYLQTEQAKDIAQAGANLIIGTHPHILQKIDYVGGVPVVFSTGNFIFNSKTQDSCMIIATLHSNGSTNLQFVPAIQSGCKVNEATGAERTRILNSMAAMSPGITIDGNGYISPK